MMQQAVIVSAVRTPIARHGGALKNMMPYTYGSMVLKEALSRAQVDGKDVDDVIYGNTLAGGGNMARYSLLEAGLPITVPGITISRQCGSGINSVALGAESIMAGMNKVVICGGTESMTLAPYIMAVPAKAFDRNPPQFYKPSTTPPHIGNPPMGITAENLVEKYAISREEQDMFALRSQQKMEMAMKDGLFDDQILPIPVKGNKGEESIFDRDEHPRPGTTLEALAKLAPAFKKGGTVTAGNASGVNDGAAALVLMSAEEAERRGLEPLAKVKSWALTGVDPNIMGIGPVSATQKVLNRVGMELSDVDLVEINEAFAAQVLACDRELKFDWDKTNVNGGAIAHGHPIAATGSILITKLVYEMRRRDVQTGLVTACIGGGQGIALILER